MKKIFRSIWREADNSTFQQRAMKKVERIAHGEKVLAPKHPTDQRVFQEAQRNEKVREELDTKHEQLIEQVNKLNIRASLPNVTKAPPDKEYLRTPHSSNMEFNKFEYGFYEPPAEKIPKNRLSFREALEVLRARIELDPESGIKRKPESASLSESSAKLLLENHAAVRRVDAARLDNMYRYFRPFVRPEKQRIVRRAFIENIYDVVEGKRELEDVIKNPSQLLKEMLMTKKITRSSIEEKRHDYLKDEEQMKMADAINAKRAEDFERLQRRLEEFKRMDVETTRELIEAAASNNDTTTTQRTSSRHSAEEEEEKNGVANADDPPTRKRAENDASGIKRDK